MHQKQRIVNSNFELHRGKKLIECMIIKQLSYLQIPPNYRSVMLHYFQ